MANNKVLLIDKLISEGWFSDEKEASARIMDRKVLVDEQPVFSAKQKVRTESIIRIKEYYKTKYVNKGGYKLEGALKQLGIDVFLMEGNVVNDINVDISELKRGNWNVFKEYVSNLPNIN